MECHFLAVKIELRQGVGMICTRIFGFSRFFGCRLGISQDVLFGNGFFFMICRRIHFRSIAAGIERGHTQKNGKQKYKNSFHKRLLFIAVHLLTIV